MRSAHPRLNYYRSTSKRREEHVTEDMERNHRGRNLRRLKRLTFLRVIRYILLHARLKQSSYQINQVGT